jgi:hypothetical protein
MKTLLLVGGLFSAFMLLPGIGFAQIGGPPGPGEWHATICSVPVEKTCLESSHLKGACASESNDFVCVEPEPEPGGGSVGSLCKQPEGIIANPNDTDPNYKYKVRRQATTLEPGFWKWKFETDAARLPCAFIESCECEPELQPRAGKCRHSHFVAPYRPVQWTHDPTSGCQGL